MRYLDCIMTQNGLTCYYNNNIFNKISNFINYNNAVKTFTTQYLDYYIGYITLRVAEMIINDICSNINHIKNSENNNTFIFE